MVKCSGWMGGEMKTIWEILEVCIKAKFMVRFAAWPGGHVSVAIHDNVQQTEQYMYEGTIDTVTEEMNEDFAEFVEGVGKVVSKPKIITLVNATEETIVPPALPAMPPLPRMS